jgi:hypothetical protein
MLQYKICDLRFNQVNDNEIDIYELLLPRVSLK